MADTSNLNTLRPLQMALDFFTYELKTSNDVRVYTDSRLQQEFGLNRCTLSRIRKGLPCAQRERYSRTFMGILNTQLLTATSLNNKKLAARIQELLASMQLALYDFESPIQPTLLQSDDVD